MATQTQIDRFRHFNRFYTDSLGLLSDHLYDCPVGLTEARLLFELDRTPGTSATDLCRRLSLDKGYVSRMLKRFGRKGWVEAAPSKTDGRTRELTLTGAGGALMRILHERAGEQARAALNPLPPADRARLLDAMAEIESILIR